MKARLPSSYVSDVHSNGNDCSFLISLFGLAILGKYNDINKLLKGNNSAIVGYSRGCHDKSIFKKFKLYQTLCNPGSIYGIDYDFCGTSGRVLSKEERNKYDSRSNFLEGLAKELCVSPDSITTDASRLAEVNENMCETLTALGVFSQLFPLVVSGLSASERDMYLSTVANNVHRSLNSYVIKMIDTSLIESTDYLCLPSSESRLSFVWRAIESSWFKWYLLTPLMTIRKISEANLRSIIALYKSLFMLCYVHPPARDLITFIFTEGSSPCRYLKCGDMLLNRLYLESLNGICSIESDGSTLDGVLNRLKNNGLAWKNFQIYTLMTYTGVTHVRTKPLSVNLWNSLLSAKTWNTRYALLGADITKMGTVSELHSIVGKLDAAKDGKVAYTEASMNEFKSLWGTICDAWDIEYVLAPMQFERDIAVLRLGCSHADTVNKMRVSTQQVEGTLTAERISAAKKLSQERSEKNRLTKENEVLKKKLASLSKSEGNTRVKTLEAEVAKYKAQVTVLEKRVNDSEVKASKADNHIKNLESNTNENEELRKRNASLEATLKSTLELLALAEAGVNEDNTEVTQGDLSELANISAGIVLPDMPSLRKLVYQMPKSHISFVTKTGRLTDIGCNKDFYFIATRRCSHKHYYFWDSQCRRAKYKQYKFHSSSYNAICHELIRISRELAKQPA